MLIAWRVVTNKQSGGQMIIAERISWEKAQEIRVNMAKRGKKVVVEIETLPDDANSLHGSLANLIGRPRRIVRPANETP